MKRWLTVLLALLVLTAVLGGYVYLKARTIEVERLTDDLYVLRGFGGNTAVLRTDVGAVVVDTMSLPAQGGWIRELARELRPGARLSDIEERCNAPSGA